MEKITVIIPMYNAQAYINLCLQSLLRQSFHDWQALIIDDGSIDRSAEICRDFSRRDNRITLFCQENKGVSAARNYGLDRAEGKFVFFLDSDDAIHPFLLEELFCRAEEYKADMAFCGNAVLNNSQMERVVNGGFQEDLQDRERPVWITKEPSEAGGWFHKNGGQEIASRIGGHLLHREFIGSLRFREDIQKGEDTLFMYHLISKSPRIIYFLRGWYYYRIHAGSLAHSVHAIRDKSSFYVFRYIRDFENRKGNDAAALAWEHRLIFTMFFKISPLRAARDTETLRLLREQAAEEKKHPLFHRLHFSDRSMFLLGFFGYPLYSVLHLLAVFRRRMLEKMGKNKSKTSVGILTFHCADNFGAMLQAYGLKTFLRGNGLDADIVRYEPPYMTGRHWWIPYAPQKDLKGAVWCVWNIWNGWKKNLAMGSDFFKKRKNMKCFRNMYLIGKKEKRAWKLPFLPFLRWPDYRAYIVGSDQIWNPELTCGLRKAYFGAFPNNRKKKVVAYGASMGRDALPPKYNVKFSQLLSHIDVVSLREEEAIPYVKAFRQEEIGAVLDPVFLLRREDWLRIEKKPDCSKGYILLYATEKNQALYAYVKKLSAEKNLPVVELEAGRFGEEGFQRDVTAGPAEFLGYIHMSDYVVTSSFHGAAFSLIYQKQFTAFLHSSRGLRISSLLKNHGLENRIYQEGMDIDDPINWDSVKRKLNKNKEASKAFLADHILADLL